jgi:formate dehydrogenase major subunit
VDPSTVKTEVFFLPAAISYEKEGSITNSGRWAQWRYQAVAPLAGARPDAEIINDLCFALRTLYRREGGANPEPFLNLTWHYGFVRADGRLMGIDPHLVAKEINGYVWTDSKVRGEPVQNFTRLTADGTTSSGCWIYSGSYNAVGNQMARRSRADPTGLGLYSGWAWSWPLNRRIIYNRASVDADGNPWDVLRAAIYWDGTKWVGDVPDGGAPPLSHEKGALPFIMKREGVASIFGPGLRDGPFPEHYEPLECPLNRNPMSSQRINPTAKLWHEGGKPEDVFANCDARYPLVASTYRVTEHWQTGVMTRNTPWLLELQPQLFVEMGEELARQRHIRNGETVKVVSARGEVEAVAIVTPRLKSFLVAGSTVHQVGLPWHYGWTTPRAGDTANLLTPTIGDPNTHIPETKAFMVDVLKKG